MEIIARAYEHPDAAALIRRLQAEYARIYGAPDEGGADPADYAPPRGGFFVGYAPVPAAIGGWRRLDDERAELKRMYVPEEHRGNGYARRMLHHLEESAAAAGAARVVLETNVRHPAAVALYRAEGYRDISNFGHYADAPGTLSLAFDLPRT